MKKFISLFLLLLPTVMMAGGYQAGITSGAKICSSPGGTVVMTLPETAECLAFIFDVVASDNGWLKIDKATFELCDYGGEEDFSDLRKFSLMNISGECWVRSADTITGFDPPACLPVGDDYYSSPSMSAGIAGDLIPTRILEIQGDWVKVEGHPFKIIDPDFQMPVYDYDRTVVGWFYQPEFWIDFCSA